MKDFMNRLREGALVPALRTELQETEQRLQSTQEMLAHTEASLQKLEALAAAWTNERQALVDDRKTVARQLCQARTQMEKMSLHSQDEVARLSRGKEAISA